MSLLGNRSTKYTAWRPWVITWSVTWNCAKTNGKYTCTHWCCLTLTLIWCRFSPPIFLFLISIVPSIWLLELHPQQQIAANRTEVWQSHKLHYTYSSSFSFFIVSVFFFSFFFKCRKLDSFESVRTTFMVNTTFGNYSTRLKVTPHSQMFTERNTHGLSQTSVQSNNEKRIKVIGHEYNMTAMHKSSSLKVSKVTEKRWVEQKF